MNERLLVLNALMDVFYKGEFSNKRIDKDIKNNDLSPSSRSFYTRLFLGTIERCLFLDAIINETSKIKTDKLRPVILNILRLSVYQMYFMDSVPSHAIINEAVKLCGKKKMGQLKGYVNGVLRAIDRERCDRECDRGTECDTSDLPLSHSLSHSVPLAYSIPLWLIEYLQESLTIEQIETLCPDRPKKDGLVLRVNESKITVDEALSKINTVCSASRIEGQEYLPAVFVSGYESIDSIPGFKDGLYYIQDLSSIRAVYEGGICPGENILDVCASPGGKGIYAAALAGEKGHVILRDLPGKTNRIRENVHRLGIKNVDIRDWDALVFDEDLRGKMDLVIADVPCSGLGTIHKKPEIKYRVSKKSIEELSKIQGQILDTVKDYVRDGGRLLYSTCTLGHIENEDNVKRFTYENSRFNVVKKEQFFPGEYNEDGFFYCLMEKQ